MSNKYQEWIDSYTDNVFGACKERTKAMVDRWGDGLIFCDASNPATIYRFRKAGLKTRKNTQGRNDSIREVGSRFQVEGDGKPRLFIYYGCRNLISELVRYEELIKENDHAIDALRYAVSNIDRATRKLDVAFGPNALRLK